MNKVILLLNYLPSDHDQNKNLVCVCVCVHMLVDDGSLIASTQQRDASAGESAALSLGAFD